MTPWKYGTALSVHISTFDFYAVPLLAFKSILLKHPMVKNARMKLHKTSSTRLYIVPCCLKLSRSKFFCALAAALEASERAFLFMYYSRLDTWRARAYNLHTSIDRQLERDPLYTTKALLCPASSSSNSHFLCSPTTFQGGLSKTCTSLVQEWNICLFLISNASVRQASKQHFLPNLFLFRTAEGNPILAHLLLPL